MRSEGKKYSVIYADPAWSYEFKEPTASKGGAKGSGYSAGVDYYYVTMTIEQIMKLPVADICEKDAVLFLWATNPLLPEALETMKQWGFKYKTMITWHKERCKGMGYWFRGHTEHILVGVKGKVKAFRSLEHNISNRQFHYLFNGHCSIVIINPCGITTTFRTTF